jgi:hypothetical protein
MKRAKGGSLGGLRHTRPSVFRPPVQRRSATSGVKHTASPFSYRLGGATLTRSGGPFRRGRRSFSGKVADYFHATSMTGDSPKQLFHSGYKPNAGQARTILKHPRGMAQYKWGDRKVQEARHALGLPTRYQTNHMKFNAKKGTYGHLPTKQWQPKKWR